MYVVDLTLGSKGEVIQNRVAVRKRNDDKISRYREKWSNREQKTSKKKNYAITK